MYKCRVEKRVWRDLYQVSGYTSLCYELEVEQTPERGGQLNDGRWFSGPLADVIWNVDESHFACRVDDEVPSKDQDYDYNHDFMVECAMSEGWRLCDTWVGQH